MILQEGERYDRDNGRVIRSEASAARGWLLPGVNIALGGAAATAGETAAMTAAAGSAGALAVAAAPAVLSVAAARLTAKMADLAIETRRIYEGVDEANARLATSSKIRNRPDGEKPSLTDYFHVGTVLAVSARMQDDALRANGKIERFPESNRIRNLGTAMASFTAKTGPRPNTRTETRRGAATAKQLAEHFTPEREERERRADQRYRRWRVRRPDGPK